MRKLIVIATCLILSATGIMAQQTQGKVIYERASQMQFSFAGMPGGMEQQVPKTRVDKFELSFGNNQSLWKQAEKENTDDDGTFTSGGAQIRMVVAGNDDVLFNNFDTKKKVEKRELFGKTFIIDDTLSILKWKMTGETKTILDMPCMKATSERISKRTQVNMDNGKMERKEIEDTSTIVAWFTSSIPVSAGPADFQGQLPGLILEMDIKDGTQTFKAVSIKKETELDDIKEPKGKKRYTAAEFKVEREKMMEEMNKNNQGGNRVIRMN